MKTAANVKHANDFIFACNVKHANDFIFACYAPRFISPSTNDL